MTDPLTTSLSLPRFHLWQKLKQKRSPISFDIELTNRCNNNCRHCYINLPADDPVSRKNELSFAELKDIIDEAVSLGVLWCLITGGEPLLRHDFSKIYLYLKKKGLLVSVFTNATLITGAHVRLFQKYPPRDIEISVYGVTRKIYEKVTRKTGSFAAFHRGLQMLLAGGVKVRLKAMALRSNVDELDKIAAFCREKTIDYFRFDPFLHLRFDANPAKNRDIKAERLLPHEIALLEQSDQQRSEALKKACGELIVPSFSQTSDNRLFQCGAGNESFILSAEGLFRLCSSLWKKECVYDLRKGSLYDAWHHFTPHIMEMRSRKKAFLEKCRVCPVINLCMWCPAHAYLETGELDQPVDYFCQTAHARAQTLPDPILS